MMALKSNSIFINCEEAVQICDKSQYKEASIWQIMKLNLHMIYCKLCRKYTKNNSKLTKLCSHANLKTLSADEKEKIQKILDSETSK